MNQIWKTRVRTSKDMDTVTADHATPIRPKSSISMPQEDEMNPKTQHDQLTGNHTVYAPTPYSTQGHKVVCEHAGRKVLTK